MQINPYTFEIMVLKSILDDFKTFIRVLPKTFNYLKDRFK